jgi:hypothetical protein
MKKTVARKISLFLLLAAVFLFAGDAEAAKRTFGMIGADVPQGWEATESENQIIFTAPDAAGLTIVTNGLDGLSVKEYAGQAAIEFNGTNPKEGDGYFTFSFKNPQMVVCKAFVYGDEEANFIMLLVQTGDHPQMASLIDSIEVVNRPKPLVKSFFF